MNKFNVASKWILGLSFFSYIYLICCPIVFKKSIYATFFNQIPFALLLIVDIILLCRNRKNLGDLLKYYIGKNKALFLCVIVFLMYDVITLLYAQTPKYSIMKYIYFFKAMVLIGSMFLLFYEGKEDQRDNIRLLIRYMEILFVLIIVTTIVQYSLGLSPYRSRISTNHDYNVFATHLMYTLIFFIWNHIRKWGEISVRRKILCILLSTFAFDLLYLSGSRRAVVLTPFVIVCAAIIYAIKEHLFSNVKNKKCFYDCKRMLTFFCVLGFVTINIILSVPTFEKIVANPEMIENFVSRFIPKRLSDSIKDSINDSAGDTLLSTRYQTISQEQGLDSRKIIWRVAFAELREYSGKDILIGRGNGYGWNLYEDVDKEGVNEILAAYPRIKGVSPQWMSPHNLVLKELLDGGIIKIILLLFLTGVILYYVIRCIKYDLIYGSMIFVLYSCFAAGCMLGGAFGLVGEKLFWLTTGILVLFKCDMESRSLPTSDTREV